MTADLKAQLLIASGYTAPLFLFCLLGGGIPVAVVIGALSMLGWIHFLRVRRIELQQRVAMRGAAGWIALVPGLQSQVVPDAEVARLELEAMANPSLMLRDVLDWMGWGAHVLWGALVSVPCAIFVLLMMMGVQDPESLVQLRQWWLSADADSMRRAVESASGMIVPLLAIGVMTMGALRVAFQGNRSATRTWVSKRIVERLGLPPGAELDLVRRVPLQ